MTKRILALLALLPLIAKGQLLSPIAPEITTKDHGKSRQFIIAADEMARRTPDGRFQTRAEDVSSTLRRTPSDQDARLVLYPTSQSRTETNRRLLTERILVKVQRGTDVALIAYKHGNLTWTAAPVLAGNYVFQAPFASEAIALAAALRNEPGVLSADPLLARKQTRKALPTDPLFPQQWYLRNRGQTGGTPGIDANVLPVWGKYGRPGGIRGAGVIIGIVDDGVEFLHPDLFPNYNRLLDYDWNDNTRFDARPNAANEDFHGTSVAGIAAARGNNGIGISGTAPRAILTGLRLIGGYEDDADEAQAFTLRSDVISIKNNSWGPVDDGQTMEAPGPLGQAALAQATTSGRNNLGTVFIWAAGNGRQNGDNSNNDGYANSIYCSAVTAIDFRGKATYYAEPGANILVGAPSDNYGNSGIVTTDLVGSAGYNHVGSSQELLDPNYTRTFGGTSAAAPVASGVVALMLQRNPGLGWRDVQEILLRTATKNDPSSANWIFNAAGFHFNHDFGAGLINAQAAVNLAARWINLPPQVVETQSSPEPVGILDGVGFVEKSFVFPGDKRVEHVTVHLQITHSRRGDLRITLISPGGTVSELAEKHTDLGSNIDWTYMSVRNWGENSGGTWRVQVQDLALGSIGTLNSAEVSIYGSQIP